MNLVSCDNCSVVIDVDKNPFPTNLYTDEGTIDHSKSIWYNRNYVPKISCPVCQNDIPKEE